jgi:purine-binding chemotaxis protein CheW
VGSLHLALSVNAVKKVLRYIPVYSSGLNHFGVANVDGKEVTVIDLHQRLFKTPQSQISGQNGYLILAKNSQGESFATWVSNTPALQDVSLSSIRVLPESYRRSDTLAIASHVLALTDKDHTLTVFLLDVDRLLQ